MENLRARVFNLRQSLAIAAALVLLVLELCVWFSDTHFLWKPKSRLSHRPEIARLTERSGLVRVRGPSQLEWLNAPQGVALYEGDEVATLEDSTAVMELSDGQKLNLGPNSVLLLKGAIRLKEPVLKFALLSGTLSQGDPSNPGSAGRKLEIEMGSKVIQTSTQENFTIGTHRELQANAVTAGREASRARPTLEAPVLLHPKIIQRATPGESAIPAPILQPARIHYKDLGAWLYRGIGLVLDGMVSSAHAEEPKAQAPERKYRVLLEWQPVPRARAYLIQISADPSFEKLLYEATTALPRTEWQTDVPGTYYWRAAAQDTAGNQSAFSEFLKFRIVAQTNLQSDESSYETYLKYDEYVSNRNTVRVMWGPLFNHYAFRSKDSVISPGNFQYNSSTLQHLQLEYDYRLDPYYSIQFGYRNDRTVLTKNDVQGENLGNRRLIQDENIVFMGLQRRYFWPRHYFTLSGAIRISYLDIPDHNAPGLLAINNFGFFGFSATGGWRHLIGRQAEAGISLGTVFQYSGDSSRTGGFLGIDYVKSINSNLFFGARTDIGYIYYKFEASDTQGRAVQVPIRCLFLLGISF